MRQEWLKKCEVIKSTFKRKIKSVGRYKALANSATSSATLLYLPYPPNHSLFMHLPHHSSKTGATSNGKIIIGQPKVYTAECERCIRGHRDSPLSQYHAGK